MAIPTIHPYDFDPTAGLGIDQLRAVRPPETPAGFDDYWRARYVAALQVNPRPYMIERGPLDVKWRVHDISYTSTDEFPIQGWLLLPRNGRVKRGMVVGHGYGGRDKPDFDIPVDDTALLFPCFRGLSRSSRPPISNDPQWHVLDHIDNRDRYILGGCVDDLWLAVSALLRLYPILEGKIGYKGISFGGGIGALGMAFDPRIDRGYLEVPTFGNMPLWLSLPSVGSAHAVQLYSKTHPEVIEAMRFFDSAVAASRIRQPMLMAVAAFDPAVAPPCQFSVANALPPSNCNETVILDAGHFDYPGSAAQHALLSAKIGHFFGAT